MPAGIKLVLTPENRKFKMSVQLIVGAQWGDEGKGKIVDRLSENAEVVVRYQGGANAGHTVYVNGKKFILHLLPSGILHPEVLCVIGNGLVFDPAAFFEELELLKESHISVDGRLKISDRVHIIFPYHKKLDQARESKARGNKIGTTGRGIGPAYVDKFNRNGIRLAEMLDDYSLKMRLEQNLDLANRILVDDFHEPPLSFVSVFEESKRFADRLKPFAADTAIVLNDAWKTGKNILLEGAQGALLDVDFGTYPFVTSSNPTCGGAVTGTGLPASAIEDVLGVMKAYCTRVGGGPFPSEEENETGERLREAGREYGATTGRPRRCGWFDVVAARYSARINGLNAVALTKLDVLDSFEKIKICTSYSTADGELTEFPANLRALQDCKPNYIEVDGWQTEISACRTFGDLPDKTQKYVGMLEELSGVPVRFISVGVEREQTIQK